MSVFSCPKIEISLCIGLDRYVDVIAKGMGELGLPAVTLEGASSHVNPVGHFNRDTIVQNYPSVQPSLTPTPGLFFFVNTSSKSADISKNRFDFRPILNENDYQYHLKGGLPCCLISHTLEAYFGSPESALYFEDLSRCYGPAKIWQAVQAGDLICRAPKNRSR